MSQEIPPIAEPISLADLIALNEEIAALVRIGIPLEVGLGGSGGLPKNLQAVTERLRSEMERGASLPDALKACGAELPPSYLALVEAGVKSNRLSDALTSAAAFARSLLEMQHHARSALIYPVLVLVIAYGFFLVLLWQLVPRIGEMLEQVAKPNSLFGILDFLSRTILYWGPAIPVLCFLAAIWMGIIPTALSRRPSVALNRLRWVPWLRRILIDVQSASFCHLLSMLVEREVPLPDALELSASASSDRKLSRECATIAAELRKGVPLNQALRTARRLPAFTRWMLTAGQSQGELPAVMATLANIYRRRARSQTEMFQIAAPLLMTAVIGGSAVAAYALFLFVPVRDLFMDLSNFAAR